MLTDFIRASLPENLPPPRLPQSADSGRKLCDRSGRPLRVLIVEDDAMVAAVLQDIVRDGEGEVIGTISSGLASVGAAASIRPDVIVMDVGLPGMDGIDAAAIIRARYAIPVVFISGRELRHDEARRLGALDRVEILLKPIAGDALCDALLRAYAGSSTD